MTEFVVAAFYKFAPLPDFEERRAPLFETLDAAGVMGTVLLASEGVNGTISGTRAGIDTALAALRALPGCEGLDHKEAIAESLPFHRLKVRLKREIVTMGVPGVDPNALVGTYVAPTDWNDLISDPDVVLIDTRNDYEVGVGTFKGAIDPETTSFREFPDWFRKFNQENKPKKVAMFCTGGIRCEKATNFVKSEGVEDVYHLHGGILKYFEDVDTEDSLWEGECFVFDNRVTVDHDLQPGSYDMCHACKWPITEEEKKHPNYEPGVACPRCHGLITDAQRTRFQERQKQMRLARERGTKHIGRKERV